MGNDFGEAIGITFFDVSFFVIITVIGLNIVLGIIVDTFSQLRDAKVISHYLAGSENMNSICNQYRVISKCFIKLVIHIGYWPCHYGFNLSYRLETIRQSLVKKRLGRICVNKYIILVQWWFRKHCLDIKYITQWWLIEQRLYIKYIIELLFRENCLYIKYILIIQCRFREQRLYI